MMGSRKETTMYILEHFDFARVSEAYDYHRKDAYGREWGIKGHNHPWILDNGEWETATTGLEVGCAYSPLPAAINEQYDVEIWGADDFGMESGQPIWKRHKNPETVMAQFPTVRYVFHRLGDQSLPDLPHNYFDRIYSVSTLEHIPDAAMTAVFQHIDALLKPGGIMLHTVDIRRHVAGTNPFLLGLYLIALAWKDRLHSGPRLATPEGWYAFLKRQCGVQRRVKIPTMMEKINNPDVLLENISMGWNRIVKDAIHDYRYNRPASLVFKLRKPIEV